MSEPPHRVERSQLVPLPVEKAFASFADAYNLEALTPPWLGFRILTPRPIPMREGTTIEYVLTTHRVPVRWRTEIVEWEPGRRFVDTQVKGPLPPLGAHACVRGAAGRHPDSRHRSLPDAVRAARRDRAPRPRRP